MTGKRPLIVFVLILLLPVLVAWLDWPAWLALLCVFALLALLWLINVSAIVSPVKCPELELETIAASHFVEKVRWCMDRLGLDYHERIVGGVLGAFFLGRSVPKLHFTTGIARSSIGNSAEILRYLWGRYGHEEGRDAAFIEPTAERLELEARIDRVGVDFQIWVYTFLLEDKELCLRAWGAESDQVPSWQVWLMKGLYPVTRMFMKFAFQLGPEQYERAVDHINAFLNDTENWLADGRGSLLGGERNFTDYAFAAINALWVIPDQYARGVADQVAYEFDELPEDMQEDISNWRTRYPLSRAFIEQLYAEDRLSLQNGLAG